MMHDIISGSLFHLLSEKYGSSVSIVRYSKPTLVHISHTIEDMILRHRLPAMIFTAFQEPSYWARETKRYRELSGIARQVTIFAGKPLPRDSALQWLPVELEQDDPMRQEWLLLVFSERFSVLLCGLDQSDGVEGDPLREFDTIMTFEPAAIQLALGILEETVMRYLPDRLPVLQAAREQYSVGTPDLRLISDLLSEIVTFQENLQRALRTINQEMKQTNEQLRREQMLRARLMESSATFFMTLDTEGKILLMNETMLQAFGYRLEDVLQQSYAALFALDPPEQAGDVYLQWQTTKATVSRVRLHTSTGESVLVEWHSRPIEGEDGRAEVVFSVGLDITEREMLAAQAIDMAIERERMTLLVDFFRVASHDFRSPLATINTSLYLLEHASSEEQRARSLQNLQQQAAHLEALVEEMFTMSKLESGDKLSFMRADVADLVRDLREETHTKREARGITLQLELAPDLPMVALDRVALHHALKNLLDNAIAHSPPDNTVYVRVTLQPLDWLAISIEDHGVGIDPQTLPYIFDRFFRGDPARSTETGGLGLGLPIARKIIEQHQGRIEVTSTPGQGSVFTVLLPLNTSDLTED